MDVLEEIESIQENLEFVRADLHIHSYSEDASFDVKDNQMTPENIIDLAIENKLKIISITDHNSITNVQKAIKYAEDKEILVLPGIEVSTNQGHLLVYFNNYKNLSDFFGKLKVHENRENCFNGIVECLSLTEQFNGFGILAHIELDSGFEKTIQRFGPQMEEIFKQKVLLGMEISQKESIDLYTENDTSNDRKRLLKIRQEHFSFESDYEIPKVMSSDAHSIDKLGKNAEGNKKLTRIKINELTFDSVRIALLLGSSRVRIEDCIPTSVPHFVGLKIEGGLLDNQVIKFSKNLNCIIGGRGTGKSTLLESLTNGAGNITESKLIDSEVWPDKINIIFEDETGKKEIFTRDKGAEVINRSDPMNGITQLSIERYGQGETAETIQHSDKDPKDLLNFLDSFIDIESYSFLDNNLRNKLYENLSDIEKLQIDVKSIPDIKKQKNNIASKIEILKKEKVGEIVGYQESLLKEKEFRKNLIEDLRILIKNYSDILSDKSLFDNVKKLENSKILVGKEQFKQVKQIVEELSIYVDGLSVGLKKEFDKKVELIKTQLKEWSSKETEIQQKIDNKRKELIESGIPFDLAQINKITKDIVFYESKLKELKFKEKQLKDKQIERRRLISERSQIRSRIFQERNNFAVSLNKNLRNTISDFVVSVKYREGLFSPNFAEFIKNTMDYRTTQVSKAKIISDNLNPFEFINKIRTKDYSAFENLQDNDGNKAFSRSDIDKLFIKFSDNNNLNYVESIEFEDKPEIIVSKHITLEDGQSKVIIRDFTKLSLGQQQSILLSILLYSKSKSPLIIDQPEDNLDSGFIYKAIVKTLRKIKEERQVIVVTHNANIAVLGDAELIIPLRGSSTKTIISARGSIDNSETQKICCDILEGGKIAFNRRKEIYGL